MEAARAHVGQGPAEPVPRPLGLQRRYARFQRPHRARRDRSELRQQRRRQRDDDDDNGGGGGNCRLWIANANGGVWRTEQALKRNPNWKYVSEGFEHNSIASLELDPNDKRADTIWAGTGEPNACGSGCEAGVGIYKSKNGGNSWSGPLGKRRRRLRRSSHV